jgi:DNA-3-methyladenine glycosylase II
MPFEFTPETYQDICDFLTERDPGLASVIQRYGYPPMWTRPNTFQTLVHFILEQQVSLASALSALNKLKSAIKDFTPSNILLLTDDELRACYCSRQKQVYIRNIALAIIDGSIDLELFHDLPDEEVRRQLTSLKGIGNWTADVYLMFVLRRADIFPIGDLAAVNALKTIRQLPVNTSKEELIVITAGWKPYRTVATMILWHYYLSSRRKD